jgi:hypothetical protein
MIQRFIHFRFNANVRLAALLCCTIALLPGEAPASAGDTAHVYDNA